MVFILSVATLLVRIWGIILMWAWFVVPMFHLQELNFNSAFGLYVFTRLFTMSKKDIVEQTTEEEKDIAKYLSFLLAFLFIIGLGYLNRLTP